MLCVAASGLWLAAVALVIQAALCQQVHHSVTFGSLWICAIVVFSATSLQALRFSSWCWPSESKPCWPFSSSDEPLQ